MMKRLATLFLLAMSIDANAQLISNTDADVTVAKPAYPTSKGPVVLLDSGHNNFAPGGEILVSLLRNDGFVVAESSGTVAPEKLRGAKIFVIANALSPANAGMDKWVLPTPSAFSEAEISEIHAWVMQGGSLLLIADHMPFAGAADALARSFGITYVNGLAYRPGFGDYFHRRDLFEPNNGLVASAISLGRGGDGKVTKVRTFTGSGFQWPEAIPLLTLDADYRVFHTKRAIEVTDDTPSVPGGGLLQAAVKNVGRGRVAVFAEAGMFTSLLVGPDRVVMGFGAEGADQNKNFVLNVFHWLSRKPGY